MGMRVLLCWILGAGRGWEGVEYRGGHYMASAFRVKE